MSRHVRRISRKFFHTSPQRQQGPRFASTTRLSRSARVLLCVLGPLLVSLSPSVFSDEPKPDEAPRVLMFAPLGVLPGATTRVAVRGLRLEGATGVKSSDGRVVVKMVSQGKSAPPQNVSVMKVGDNQVEFEAVVPADMAAGNVEILVVTPQGEVKLSLPVAGEFATILEQEPNPGFKQPQALQLPQIVIGQIENANDVDVFALDCAAGQKIVCETFAQRLGSGCDTVLSVYDAAGRLIGSNDDLPDSPDSRVEFTAVAAGRVFVVVQDAFDTGGGVFPYRLVCKPAP